MEGGLFLLLCLLALLIGSRARNTRSRQLTPKAVRQRLRAKLFLASAAFVVITLMLLFYIPAFVEAVLIALDTSFSWDILIGLGIIVVGITTLIFILKMLKDTTRQLKR